MGSLILEKKMDQQEETEEAEEAENERVTVPARLTHRVRAGGTQFSIQIIDSLFPPFPPVQNHFGF
jgi:hypothetical protein